jgi:hypothetical protein
MDGNYSTIELDAHLERNCSQPANSDLGKTKEKQKPTIKPKPKLNLHIEVNIINIKKQSIYTLNNVICFKGYPKITIYMISRLEIN